MRHYSFLRSVLAISVVKLSSQECTEDAGTCDSIQYNWQAGVQYEDFDAKFLLGWLKSQASKIHTVCPVDATDSFSNDEAKPLKIVKDPKPCLAHQKTEWDGKWSANGLPKGQGRLSKMKQSHSESKEENLVGSNHINSEQLCIDLSDGIDNFQGGFAGAGEFAGSPQGRGKITFEYDLSSLHGQLVGGAFHGQVQLMHSNGDLLFSGVFRRGRAEGPGWIFPPDWKRSGFVQAFFKAGEIQAFPVLWFGDSSSADGMSAMVGTLNGSSLDNAVRMQISDMGDYNCLKFARVPENIQYDGRKSGISTRIPVIIKTVAERGMIVVRSSKTLVFNRIAKTGSQALTELLVQLDERGSSGVRPVILLKTVEHLMEPPQMVAAFVASVDSEAKPAAFVKHYNFVDFTKYGALTNPNYINIVRHPVDRIVSWFYYWRAAWNIVERKLAYPDEPLPDPESLRKDFDTCVLTGDPECQYIEDTNVMQYPDHRSQMTAFCGHEAFCAQFNSEAVLSRAKENVEKHYSVVGVLEDMNKTLAVMEKVLPDVFGQGAAELYHENAKIRKKQNRNAYKMPVSAKVLDMVYKNFTREIEFYNFVKQRLDKQYALLFPEEV